MATRASYHHIVADLLTAIRSGDLGVGDRLPRERELAERYSASTATVRRAVRELQTMGVTEGRQGSGNYVRSLPATEPSSDEVDHLEAARQALRRVEWDRLPAVDAAQLHMLLSIAESIDHLARQRGS